MKQITLKTEPDSTSTRLCIGRLAVLWGLYGAAMALLWNLAGSTPEARGVAWAMALLVGFALLVGMRTL
jgi:hypothetical protein